MPAKAEEVVFSAKMRKIEMSDHQLTELIERYLNGEMSREERLRFEEFKENRPEIDARIAEHRQFIGMLKHYGERLELEQRLNAIHSDIDVHGLTDEVTIKPNWVVQMWRHHHSKISVAASIAIFAILSTMFFTGYFKKGDPNSITALRIKLDKIETKTDILAGKVKVNGIGAAPTKHINYTTAYGGTGFALTSNGYLVTNYHVVKGADSVYVENADGNSFHAKVVYTEPAYDLAFLKIDDASFQNLGNLPYAFKKGKSYLGEEVWNYGYPGNQPYYGSGSISASGGINGDTTSYQVSIPVNPGASGSPLIDAKGNVIGIINLKQAQIEGAHFAIKSNYLMKAIENIPADSLKNKLNLNSKNTLAGMSRPQQVEKMKKYIFKVKAFE